MPGRTLTGRPSALALTAVVLVVMAAGGCVSQFADFHVREISSVRVDNIDADGFDMTVGVAVENPNRMTAEVSDIRFTASMGEHVLGAGRGVGTIRAGARTVFPMTARMRVRFEDLPGDLPGRVKDGSFPLTVAAAFQARTRVGHFAMKLRETGRTAIDQTLQVVIAGGLRGSVVQITGIERVGLALTGVRLQVRVSLANALPFPVRIIRGEIFMLLGGRRVSATRVDSAIELPARGKVDREFLVQVSHGDMLRLARSLAEGELATRATGTLWIEPIGGVARIPFDVATELSAIEGL